MKMPHSTIGEIGLFIAYLASKMNSRVQPFYESKPLRNGVGTKVKQTSEKSLST